MQSALDSVWQTVTVTHVSASMVTHSQPGCASGSWILHRGPTVYPGWHGPLPRSWPLDWALLPGSTGSWLVPALIYKHFPVSKQGPLPAPQALAPSCTLMGSTSPRGLESPMDLGSWLLAPSRCRRRWHSCWPGSWPSLPRQCPWQGAPSSLALPGGPWPPSLEPRATPTRWDSAKGG